MSQVQENGMVFEGETITTSAPQAISGNEKRGIAPLTKPEGWSITLPNPVAGKTLDEVVALYGEDKVLELFNGKLIIDFQGAVRGMAERGRSDDEIREVMANWKPGQKVNTPVSPQQAILKNFGSMTPEQKAELIAQLTALKG